MKKIVLFIMIIVFLFSGCKGSSGNEINRPDISFTPMPSTGTPVASPIITPSDNFTSENKIIICYLADKTHKYTNRTTWQEYIQDKFGISIEVNYIATSPEYLINGERELEGILYLNTVEGVPPLYNTYVYDYATSEIAVELSQYYRKYGWDQYIDSEYLEFLENNGAIYAVPAVNSKYIVPRYYNKEYLSALNMEVPANINELYDFMKESKKLNAEDPEFYPTMIWHHALTQGTADIFRAHDVYVNSSWNKYFAYNPNTATFENAVFAEEFETALTFIRTLQSEDLMAIYGRSYYANENNETANMFMEDIRTINQNFATEYNYIYNTDTNRLSHFTLTEPIYERVNGYYLLGTNPSNLCEIRSDISFYVFPKTIDNINGAIDLFNDIFTNSQYYADLRYGIEGTDYILNDNLITSLQPVSGQFMSLKQIKYIDDPNACYAPASIEAINRITSNIAYESNVFNQFRTYLSSFHEKGLLMGGTFFDALFYESVSPYDAIQMYKDQFKQNGWKKVIDDMNEKLGTVSTYNYDN